MELTAPTLNCPRLEAPDLAPLATGAPRRRIAGVGSPLPELPIVAIRVLTDAQADRIDDSWTYDQSRLYNDSPGTLTKAWENLRIGTLDWARVIEHYGEQLEKAAVYRPGWLDWAFGDSATREDIHRVILSDTEALIRSWNTQRVQLEYRLWVLSKLADSGQLEADREMMVPVRGREWADRNYQNVLGALKAEANAMQGAAEAYAEAFAAIAKVAPVMEANPIPETFWDGFTEYMAAVGRITGKVVAYTANAAGNVVGATVSEFVKAAPGVATAGIAVGALVVFALMASRKS